MNWIIQRRILAFSSPVSPCKAGIKAEGVRPQKFIERFQLLRIKHIVRLNDSLYDEEIFSKAGITIHDLEFPDGTCPDMVIFNRVNNKLLGYGCKVYFYLRSSKGTK